MNELSSQFPGHIPGLLLKLVSEKIDSPEFLVDSVRYLVGILNGKDPSVISKDFPNLSHKNLSKVSDSVIFDAHYIIQEYSRIRIEKFIEAIHFYSDALFLVAAGNKGSDLKKLTDTELPLQTLSLPNLLVIGSVDPLGNYSKFSNYSSELVHFAVEGENINVPNEFGALEQVSGTSFAVARVTRTVALMLAANPSLSVQEILEILRSSMILRHELQKYTKWGGILDEKMAIDKVKISTKR